MDRLSGSSASGGEYKPMIPPKEEGLINQKLPSDMIRSILSRCHVREQVQGPLTVCKSWSELTVAARRLEINETLKNMKELLIEGLNGKLNEEQKAKLFVLCAPKQSNGICLTTEDVFPNVLNQLLDILSGLSIEDINELQKYIESKKSEKPVFAELKDGERIDVLNQDVFDRLRQCSAQVAVKSMPAGPARDKTLKSIAISLLEDCKFDEVKSTAAEIQDPQIKSAVYRELCIMVALFIYEGNIENSIRLTKELFPETQQRVLIFNEISQNLIQLQVNSEINRFEDVMKIVDAMDPNHAVSTLLSIYAWLKFIMVMNGVKPAMRKVLNEQATQVYERLRETLTEDGISRVTTRLVRQLLQREWR